MLRLHPNVTSLYLAGCYKFQFHNQSLVEEIQVHRALKDLVIREAPQIDLNGLSNIGDALSGKKIRSFIFHSLSSQIKGNAQTIWQSLLQEMDFTDLVLFECPELPITATILETLTSKLVTCQSLKRFSIFDDLNVPESPPAAPYRALIQSLPRTLTGINFSGFPAGTDLLLDLFIQRLDPEKLLECDLHFSREQLPQQTLASFFLFLPLHQLCSMTLSGSAIGYRMLDLLAQQLKINQSLKTFILYDICYEQNPYVFNLIQSLNSPELQKLIIEPTEPEKTVQATAAQKHKLLEKLSSWPKIEQADVYDLNLTILKTAKLTLAEIPVYFLSQIAFDQLLEHVYEEGYTDETAEEQRAYLLEKFEKEMPLTREQILQHFAYLHNAAQAPNTINPEDAETHFSNLINREQTLLAQSGMNLITTLADCVISHIPAPLSLETKERVEEALKILHEHYLTNPNNVINGS
jgi:hypothetical protein